MQARPLPPRPNLEQYRKQAKELLKGGGSKVYPKLADAQFFIAREHGFESWPRFSRHVQALERGHSRDARFEAAADAIVSGDIPRLKQLLRDDPGLVRARSQRTHNAALLHYVAANGVEDFRQKTTGNVIEIAELLLDAGAGVNEQCRAYGGNSTALSLVATSVHPERAGLQEQLMQLLLDRGAAIDVLVIRSCLWNGRGKAAGFLASRGGLLDLETAAGVGNLEVVKSHLDEGGEKLQRGFLWACEYGHNDVAEFLLAHGANLRDQAGTGQTALHWAVIGGQLATIKLLLSHSAPLDELNKYGATPLGQARWSSENGNPEIGYAPIFEALNV